MKISVIGTGYVGLVAGSCFADMGHEVICVDKIQAKIDMLKNGEIPIYEPGLSHLVKRNVKEKRLRFTTDLVKAIEETKVIFIAVGTPTGEDGSADLRHVLDVTKIIAQAMNGYKIIVNKSTVPVGTAEKMTETIKQETRLAFDVVSNPEFLKEGTAVNDFLKPERVVIGAASKQAMDVMEDLYAPFSRNHRPVIFMDVKSAELTKYAANAMLATRISFMNEIANLCERVDANVDMVRKGMGTDSRIGKDFLYPGIGYGGSCFPKDVKALIRTAKESGLDFGLLQSVEDVNERQKKALVKKVKAYYGNDLTGKTFGVWGLAFKPETDDIREAPSLVIIDALLKAGAKIKAADPEAMEEARKILGDKIQYYKERYEAVKDTDGLIICTEWQEYRVPDFDTLKTLLKKPVIFDGRNLYAKTAAQYGFDYFCMGAK